MAGSVTGIDGCAGGWVAVTLSEDGDTDAGAPPAVSVTVAAAATRIRRR